MRETQVQPETPTQQLAMRKGDEDVQIRDVVLVRDPGVRTHLVFYSEDVECEGIAADPTGQEGFVAMAEIETDAQGTPRVGQVPPATWTYPGARRTGTMRGQPGWVTITRVPDTETVEGTVAVATTVERERFELNGPFTATVCDVRQTATTPREDAQRQRPPQGVQQHQQNQPR